MKIYNSSGIEIIDIQVDDSSVRYRSIMSDDSLTLKFSHTATVSIPVGSYVIFEGQRYTLWLPENVKKHNTRNFEYTVVLGGYREALKLFKYKDMSSMPYRLKFSLTAKPVEFLQLLVDNMNIHDTGWTVGDCIDTSERTISFNHEYCSDVLSRIAQEFSTEYEFESKKIHLGKVEKFKDAPLALSYGKGNGFKSGVARANDGDKQPIGRLYVQGGERNIDYSKYGSTSLLLPKSATLVVDGKTYRTDAHGMYITRDGNNLLAEDSYDAQSIYPSRIGTISEVIAVDVDKHFYDIKDASIPASLDYSACRIDGEKATISFQSGALAGREFDIEQTDKALTGYVHAERRFKIVPQELDGVVMPGGAFVPAVGDKYAIFNISLPNSYIDSASMEMFQECVKYFAENEKQKFSFTGELDGIWAKSQWLAIGGKIVPGGHVLFSDDQFLPNGEVVRIVSVKDYVNFPHKPEITLSNAPVSGGFNSILGKLEAEEVVIEGNKKEVIQYSKRQWRDARETMAMLEDSLLQYSSGINPITVNTMQLLVGDESLQFRFVNSKTTPVQTSHNVTFNTSDKKLTASSGIIQHMTLGINKVSPQHAPSEYKFWDMAGYVSPPLDGDKAYYLYAKCNKTTQSGTFLLSETAIAMEGVAGYYHFLMGIVNSERDNERSIAMFYGFTEVTPGRITTPMISSPDGRLTIDLINSIVTGKINFRRGDDVVDMEVYADDVDTDISNAENNAIAGAADYTDDVASVLSSAIYDIESDIENNISPNLSNAISKANQAAAVTDKFGVTIDGGLISTVMMLLRELNSQTETAGISGIQGLLRDNPAFWAGGKYEEAFKLISFLSKMSAGTAPDSGEYAGLAKITMLHNGAAKIGDFIIEESGRIVMVDPATGKPRLVFAAENIPNLEALVNSTNDGGNSIIGSGTISMPTEYVFLSGAINVTKDNSTITIDGWTLDVGASSTRAGYARVNVQLTRNGAVYTNLGDATVTFDYDTGAIVDKVATINIPTRIISFMPAGEYRLRLFLSTSWNILNADGYFTGSKLTWTYTQLGVRYFQFGLDGMMAYFSNNHIHFTETTGWDVRGKTNMPGVLASGTVNINGGLMKTWGAKINYGSAITGGYRIYLKDMTHDSYSVQVTPHTATTFMIGTKTSTYFEILGTGAADFVVFGSNY